MLGVRAYSSPAYPHEKYRSWSAKRNTRFGGLPVAAWPVPAAFKPVIPANAAVCPMNSLRLWFTTLPSTVSQRLIPTEMVGLGTAGAGSLTYTAIASVMRILEALQANVLYFHLHGCISQQVQ